MISVPMNEEPFLSGPKKKDTAKTKAKGNEQAQFSSFFANKFLSFSRKTWHKQGG